MTDDVVVRFDGVTRQFGPDIRGLDDVSMTVRRGEIAVLLGLSGSGKSTLLRHVDGLQRPTSGTVTVLGTDVGRAGGASCGGSGRGSASSSSSSTSSAV